MTNNNNSVGHCKEWKVSNARDELFLCHFITAGEHVHYLKWS